MKGLVYFSHCSRIDRVSIEGHAEKWILCNDEDDAKEIYKDFIETRQPIDWDEIDEDSVFSKDDTKKLNAVRDIVGHADDAEKIRIHNLFCDLTDIDAKRIYKMEEFDSVVDEFGWSPYETALAICHDGVYFDPDAKYFQITLDENGYYFNSFEGIGWSVNLYDIARYAVLNNYAFDNADIEKILKGK